MTDYICENCGSRHVTVSSSLVVIGGIKKIVTITQCASCNLEKEEIKDITNSN